MFFRRQKEGHRDEFDGEKAVWKMRITLGLAGIIMIVLVVIAMYKPRTDARVTLGLGPQSVVEKFYNAVNSYDLYILRNCVDTSEVTPINNRIMADMFMGFVIHMEDITHGNPEMNHEGIVFNPDEWLAAGKPALKWGERVMGIHDLRIQAQGENRFRVAYDYYVTLPLEDGVGLPVPLRERCVDVCTLENRKGCWLIIKIAQQELA